MFAAETNFHDLLLFCFLREEEDFNVLILVRELAQTVKKILWYRPVPFIRAPIGVAMRDGVVQFAFLARPRAPDRPGLPTQIATVAKLG